MEVYGARKVWHELNRQACDRPGRSTSSAVARSTVERLMSAAGLRRVLRDKHPRTTRPTAETDRPADLVDRDFTATRPNELWVADLVRHEALWDRVEVEDLHRCAVAAAR